MKNFKELFTENTNKKYYNDNSYADFHGYELDLDKSQIDKNITVTSAKRLGNREFEIYFKCRICDNNEYRLVADTNSNRYTLQLNMPHALDYIGSYPIQEKTIEDTLNASIKHIK